jgi:hypothetical protein
VNHGEYGKAPLGMWLPHQVQLFSKFEGTWRVASTLEHLHTPTAVPDQQSAQAQYGLQEVFHAIPLT